MSQEKTVIREFVPSHDDVTNGVELPGGVLSIRTDDYSTRLPKLTRLAKLLTDEALQFEPPLTISEEDLSVVVYAGERIKRIPGIEVRIPSGHVVSEQYVRRQIAEFTYVGN